MVATHGPIWMVFVPRRTVIYPSILLPCKRTRVCSENSSNSLLSIFARFVPAIFLSNSIIFIKISGVALVTTGFLLPEGAIPSYRTNPYSGTNPSFSYMRRPAGVASRRMVFIASRLCRNSTACFNSVVHTPLPRAFTSTKTMAIQATCSEID